MEADDEILRYADELAEQITPGKSEPDTLTWDNGLPLDAVVVQYVEVKLPQAMRGRLTAEEWRPLLASSIVYYQDLRNWNKGTLFRLVIPEGLADIPLVFALLYVFRLTNHGTATIDLVLIIGAYLFYTGTVLALYIHWFWRARFYAADKRAAEIVGLSSLVQSLVKIRDAALASNITKKRNRLFPTINHRIQKLNKIRGGAQS